MKPEDIKAIFRVGKAGRYVNESMLLDVLLELNDEIEALKRRKK